MFVVCPVIAVSAVSVAILLKTGKVKSGPKWGYSVGEEDATWLGSKGKSNLDHIIASTALKFKTSGTSAKPYHVRIDGWAKLAGAERTAYLKNISDHCLLYAKVMT